MAKSAAASVLAWALLREARARAGLSQAGLADRAGTSQSAIARYELAEVLPSLETLDRLIRACDLELRLVLEPLRRDEQAERRLAMSVDARLRDNDEVTRLLAEFQNA